MENVSISLPSSASSQKLSQIRTSAHEFVMPYLPDLQEGILLLLHPSPRQTNPSSHTDHSLVIAVCLEQVCEKMQTGVKCKSSNDMEFARDNGEKVHLSFQGEHERKKEAQTIGGRRDDHSRVHGRFRPIREQVCQALPFGG